MAHDDDFSDIDRNLRTCECCGRSWKARTRRARFCSARCSGRGKPMDGVNVPMIPLSETRALRPRQASQERAPVPEPTARAIRLPSPAAAARREARGHEARATLAARLRLETPEQRAENRARFLRSTGRRGVVEPGRQFED